MTMTSASCWVTVNILSNKRYSSPPLFSRLGTTVQVLHLRGEGHCPVGAVRGRGAASSICTRMTDTSQTLSLALIGCVDPGAVDPCKSSLGHWVEPQTVDFYTAVQTTVLTLCHVDIV